MGLPVSRSNTTLHRSGFFSFPSIKRIWLRHDRRARRGKPGFGTDLLRNPPFDHWLVLLVALLWESPEVVIRVDESLNSRIFEIVFSFLGFLDHPLSGHGFDSWTSYVLEKSREFPLANFAPGDTGRITSFFGSLLFELGLAAAPLFYFIFRAARIYQKTTKVSVWFQLVF